MNGKPSLFKVCKVYWWCLHLPFLISFMPEHSTEVILWKGRPVEHNCQILMSQKKEKIKILDQEPEINNATVPQERMLFVFCAWLRNMQCIQALGVFASIVTYSRVPLRTDNHGVIETNHGKCFLLDAIYKMLLNSFTSWNQLTF